jgi:OHCU decarboxylase
MTQTAIARINALDRAAFTALLGSLYEHSPWAADGAFDQRPFADSEALLAALRQTVDQASDAARMTLLRAHPELAGDRVRAKSLTAASISEQASVGLDQLSEPEIAEWARLNAAYRERFGFPFIICVRLHTKTEILDALNRRLSSSPGQEMREAILQIHDIARLRLMETLDRLQAERA